MKLVNNSTGQLEEVPDTQASQAFLSGKYGVQADQKIHARKSDGSIGTVAPEHLQDFLKAGGQLASDAEAHQAELEQKHGGLGGTLAAGAEGAARGLTLGLSDPLAVGAGRLIGGDKTAEDVRTHLAEEKEAHPYVSTAGELAGAAAPVILSGGTAAPEAAAVEAGTLARVAEGVSKLGALPRAVSGLGDLAEAGVSHVLGATAEHTLPRAAQAAAKAALRATVEGGLFGAGQAESDASLENKDLTAERLFHTVGHAALTAGVLGGGTAALGTLAKGAGSRLLGGFDEKLEAAKGEQAWRWVGGGKTFSKEANARAGGTEAVGQTVFDQVLKPLVEQRGVSGAAVDPETKLELVRQAQDRVGNQIGSLLQEHGDTQVTLGDILKPIDDRIGKHSTEVGGESNVAALQKLRSSVMRVMGADASAEVAEGAAAAGEPVRRTGQEIAEYLRENPAAAADYVQNPTAHPEITFKSGAPSAGAEAMPDAAEMPVRVGDLVKQRRSLQRIAYQESKSLDPQMRVQLLRDVSSEWRDLEDKALNEATKDAPEGGAGDMLRELNKQYQHLSIAEKSVESQAAGWGSNRMFSLTDYMAGIAHAPSMLLSGNVAGAAGTLATSMGHHWLREHGNAYASLFLDRLASLGEASRASSLAEKATEDAIGEMVESKGTRKIPRLFHVDTGRYDEERDRVSQMAAVAPGMLAGHLANVTAPLGTHLPGVQAALQQQTILATNFLASKLPQPNSVASDSPSLTPHLDAPLQSDAEKAKFLRYVEAVQGGPPEIFKRMKAGHLVPEDLETLQTVYKNELENARAKAEQKLADASHPPSYQQRVILSALLGRPADATMTPQFAAAAQQALTPVPAPKAPPQKPRSKKGPTALAAQKSSATSFETAEAG